MYQIKFLHQQLSMLTVREIEAKLKYVNQKNFEFANKPGKWLAYKLRKDIEKKMILKIQERYKVLLDNASTFSLIVIPICIKHKIFLQERLRNILKIRFTKMFTIPETNHQQFYFRK